MNQYRKVGKIKDAHGLKGDLYVLIFSKDTSWLKQLTTFALGPDESNLKTYTVEKAKVFKDGLMLKPKDVTDRNQSEALKGQMFYIPEELLVSDEGETIFLDEILNFDFYSGDENIGVITGFSSNGFQDLLIVKKTKDQKDAEVPFVEDFIENIDFENRRVIMNLPEGLLDLTEEKE